MVEQRRIGCDCFRSGHDVLNHVTERIQFPNLDSRVIRARNERSDRGNPLDLVDPIGMAVKICYQIDWRTTRVHCLPRLAVVDLP